MVESKSRSPAEALGSEPVQVWRIRLVCNFGKGCINNTVYFRHRCVKTYDQRKFRNFRGTESREEEMSKRRDVKEQRCQREEMSKRRDVTKKKR